MEAILKDWIVPLAFALAATAIGSYLTAMIKAVSRVVPPLLVNWLIGIVFYVVLVGTPLMVFSAETVGMMTICLLGVNLMFWKNVGGLRDYMEKWARERKTID